MKAEEAAKAFDEAYCARMEQLGSLNQASLAMRKDRNYLNEQIRRRRIRVGDALTGLERMNDPLPEETFYTAFCRLDADPALVLAAARESQVMDPDFYFGELAPRLARLAEAGPSTGGAWQSQAQQIANLDQLRRRDRQTAKECLQQLIDSLVGKIEASGERPPRAFGDLASALGVLAVLQRYAGRRGDALDLLLAARPLSLLSDDRVAEGDWFVKAAMLLVDLSRNSRASQFLLEASGRYFLAGATAKQAEAAVGRAYVLTHAGQHADSRKLLEQVLPLIEEKHSDIRLFAHQTLATNLQALGELAGAGQQLSAAIELVGDDLLARASCLWSQGRLSAELGDNPSALASFQESLPLVAKLTGAAELAELAMEYAKLLLKEERRPELRALAADLSGWIQQLRGTRKLRDTIHDFTALIELEKLSEITLQKILERILKAKKAK